MNDKKNEVPFSDAFAKEPSTSENKPSTNDKSKGVEKEAVPGPTQNFSPRKFFNEQKKDSRTTGMRISVTHNAQIKALKEAMQVKKYDDIVEMGIELILKHKLPKLSEEDQETYKAQLRRELKKL